VTKNTERRVRGRTGWNGGRVLAGDLAELELSPPAVSRKERIDLEAEGLDVQALESRFEPSTPDRDETPPTGDDSDRKERAAIGPSAPSGNGSVGQSGAPNGTGGDDVPAAPNGTTAGDVPASQDGPGGENVPSVPDGPGGDDVPEPPDRPRADDVPAAPDGMGAQAQPGAQGEPVQEPSRRLAAIESRLDRIESALDAPTTIRARVIALEDGVLFEPIDEGNRLECLEHGAVVELGVYSESDE
jgi:hypothetical protein